MSLKVKLAVLLSAIVSVILLASFSTVYIFYADYRQDEFYQRLKDKCSTTYKLLIEVEEIDHELLQVIDKNTINALYDEKVLIFDSDNRLVYSSIDDKKISYSLALLDQIRREGEIRTIENESEVFGMLVKEPTHIYVIVAAAFDKFGKQKLENLKWIMIITASFGLVLTAILSFFYASKVINPLEKLNLQVQRINEDNMREKVTEGKSKDEISSLAKNFNLMLDRIDNAFAIQKRFVQHASHELRTPIASMISQTEFALDKTMGVNEYKVVLNSLLEDQRDLADLFNALLFLSQYEQVNFNKDWPLVRIDEIIYKSIDMVQALYEGYNIKFDFADIPDDENVLRIPGEEILLQSAFLNIFKNACHYSEDKRIQIEMNFSENGIRVKVDNQGNTLSPEEITQLFTPFFRGQNSATRKGYGLGLSICQRIVEIHKGKISYTIPQTNINRITVILPKHF